MHTLKRLSGFAVLLAAIVTAVSFFLKDSYPDAKLIDPRVFTEPVQIKVEKEPIIYQEQDITYTIQPLYEYELFGLIVSDHHTESLTDYYHRAWQDYLNIKDICVLWGDNARSGLYQNMHFKNGSFTCYWRTSDNKTWAEVDESQIANNHLLITNNHIRSVVKSMRRGDQVRIKGYLATYSHDQGFERGTSTTRTDTGNGACETIFVTEAEILHTSNPVWDSVYMISIVLLVVSLIFWLFFFFTLPVRY